CSVVALVGACRLLREERRAGADPAAVGSAATARLRSPSIASGPRRGDAVLVALAGTAGALPAAGCRQRQRGVGLLLTVFAVGGLVGTVLAPWVRRRLGTSSIVALVLAIQAGAMLLNGLVWNIAAAACGNGSCRTCCSAGSPVRTAGRARFDARRRGS